MDTHDTSRPTDRGTPTDATDAPFARSPLLGLSQRVPPANERAEMALLGAALANNKAVELVEEFLRPEHFADPVHRCIYQAILERTARGQRADAVTLKTDFENTGLLDEVGGTAYLAQLLTAMVGVVGAAEYGRTILDCWVRRELIGAGAELVDDAFGQDPGLDGLGALERAEARLLRVAEGAGDAAPTVGFGDAVAQAVAGTRAAAARGDGLAGLDTGYGALNRLTKGLLPGAFYVLAARPSMGKTALALAVAARVAAARAYAARAGAGPGAPPPAGRVLFWSGEMTAAQLGARAAAAQAGLATTAVFTGRGLDVPDDAPPEAGQTRPLTLAEWTRLAEAQTAAAGLPLEIDERPALSVAALRARARRLKRRGGLSLVVVDYLGLMRASEEARRQNRYAEVADVSRGLKALAKELDVPVLALAQLNRANEAREDKRPTMADLRDSGTIEQDADGILLLHRPHYYLSRQALPERKANETAEEHANRVTRHVRGLRDSAGWAEIDVPKNKHGATGVVRLRFTDRTTWFRDEGEDERDPAWSGPWPGRV